MKNIYPIFYLLLINILSVQAQSPTVYCTFWNGSSEYMAHINFTTNSVDSVGKIQGSTFFPVAQANGYDSYRNRYYTISNQGLVAIDASTGVPVFTAAQYTGGFKHLSYNPTTDLLFATRYNGTTEEFYQISPVTFEIVNQGVLDLGNPYFVIGFYGSDAFANEVIFQTPQSTNNIKTVNMSTGMVTKTFTKPAYLTNVLLAAHDPQTDLYYAVGLKNSSVYLIQINKSTSVIDTVGRITGATTTSLSGSALDVVNRKFIYNSNLGITVVSLDNPTNTIAIPYPTGAINVKGFQTNYFSAPLPRLQGQTIRAQFKIVEAWLKDGVEILNSSTSDFVPSESGNYSYRIRRPDGATAISSEIPFSITRSKTDQLKTTLLFSFNLLQEKLTLQLPEKDMAEINIYNSAGRNMKSGMINNNEVNVRSLPSGVYQIVAQQGNQQLRGRFLKP